MRLRHLFLHVLCLPLSAAPLLKPDDRVLFLGDSNTHNGLYIAALDLMVRCRMPGTPVEFINAGLSSETLSGTSEKHHPWPRPDRMKPGHPALTHTHWRNMKRSSWFSPPILAGSSEIPDADEFQESRPARRS